MGDIDGIEVGKHHPADAAEQPSRQALPEAAAAVGQDHEHQRKQQTLHHQQQHEPQVQQVRQQPDGRVVQSLKEGKDGIAEDMEHQGQQQHDLKGEGIEHADKAGVEIAPVLGYAVDGVQPGEQAVDPPAGRPQGRQGADPRHRPGGPVVHAVNQPPGGVHHGLGKDQAEHIQQALHRKAGVAQAAEDQQQGRKHRQHHEVARVGRQLGNVDPGQPADTRFQILKQSGTAFHRVLLSWTRGRIGISPQGKAR